MEKKEIEALMYDIICAKQWLTPVTREPSPVEIHNCICELNQIVFNLKKKLR